jgi:Beta propeller domain
MRIAATTLALALLLPSGCVEPRPNRANTRHSQRTLRTLPPVSVMVNAKAKATPKASPPTEARALGRSALDPLRYDRLTRFTSPAAFKRYLHQLGQAQRKATAALSASSGILGLLGANGAMGADAQDALGGLIGNQIGSSVGVGGLGLVGTGRGGGGGGEGTIGLGSITNNQELGVDEGDIVKASGDYLVILRRGRLFSVRRRDGQGRAVLQPAGRCNAYPTDKRWGAWYDEMLVRGRRVVVIGYNYRERSTEVGLFRLRTDGQITRQATHFLRSGDYYSSRNYASRLIGQRLLFYMPYALRIPAKGPVELPAVASWNLGQKRRGPWRTILREVDVYQPVQRALYPTLHTVVSCDLSRPTLTCSARAVVGSRSRSFYVSRKAVYVWVGANLAPRGQQARDGAYLYRMPLSLRSGDRGAVTAVRAQGQPLDQLSFKESADGQINVLLTADGRGDGMGSPERAQGRLSLLRLPLWMLSAAPQAAPAAAYTALPGGTRWRYALHNRYVGDWLLWGQGAGWWRKPKNGGTLYATHLQRPNQIQRLSLDHGVDRIEALGRNAVAVGSGKGDLFFSAVALGQQARVSNTWVRPNAAQGETRTHGFFFLPTSRGGGGVLGLPVRLQGRPGQHLVRGSAEVTFLSVSDELRFTPLGALSARAGRINDRCRVSCVDWYGNARPIFINGRVFALLGYELVEGKLTAQGRLNERGRVRFL